MENAIDTFQERLRLRCYAENSIRTYSGCLSKFLRAFESCDMNQVAEEAIAHYMACLVEKEGVSESYQKQMLFTICLYFDLCLNRKVVLRHLCHRRRKHRLPRCLGRQEVKRMIEAADNVKHRCILKLLYGAGLRVSEVLALTPSDIDSANMLVHIRSARGRKGRAVMLSGSLLADLRDYYRRYKPRHFLFEGRAGGPYSARSVQAVVQQAAIRAKIDGPVSPHILRRSFARHLIESGTDIRYVQELLGHRSVKTTEVYAHIIKVPRHRVKSPLDQLL